MEEELVYGRNAVYELVKAGRPLNKVIFQSDARGERNQELLGMLRQRNIPYQFVDRHVLDRLSNHQKHQGVLAYMAAREYAEVEDILALAESKGEEPFILVLDEVEDPHNLGALLRTVDAAGAHGVVIPKRRSVALTGIVAKTSAGAVEHVHVARVSNIVQTLQELKGKGCWISGADATGKDAFTSDLSGPRVLVIGSEGKGLGRLVRESCDELISLPMQGKISSLNASVAGSILLYEILRQRRGNLKD